MSLSSSQDDTPRTGTGHKHWTPLTNIANDLAFFLLLLLVSFFFFLFFCIETIGTRTPIFKKDLGDQQIFSLMRFYIFTYKLVSGSAHQGLTCIVPFYEQIYKKEHGW